MANIFTEFYNRIKQNASKSAAQNKTATVGGRTVSTNTGSNRKATTTGGGSKTGNFGAGGRTAATSRPSTNKATTSYRKANTSQTATVGGRTVSTASTQGSNRKFSDTVKLINSVSKATMGAVSAANRVKMDNGMGSPLQKIFQKTGQALNTASDYLEKNNRMNTVQQSHLDSMFNGKISTDTVKEKIKADPTYGAKLMDQNGNIIDYTKQIDELNGRLENTYNPYEKKQLKDQLSLFQEYQADQNRLIWSSNYDYLVENGASEEDLNNFKIAVNREDMDGINRALANFTSTVEGYIGNAIKGSETMFATVSDLLGVDYRFSPMTDKIIDDAETLQQLSMQGASGMEKLIYEVYDGMAPFLYSLGIAQYMGGASSYLGNEEAAKALNGKALLLSDVSTLGSAMKQNLDNGYTFEQARDNAFLKAALSHITENIGGESLANILTGEIGVELLENTADYMIRSMANQFFAEATEEGMEAAVEPLIDAMTHNTGMTVEQYINDVFSKDTAYQMLIGGLGGLAMGAPAAYGTASNYNVKVKELMDSIGINSKRDYKAAVEAVNKLEEIISNAERSTNRSEADNDQIYLERMLLKAFKSKVSQYYDNHPYMDAITTQNENPAVSVDGNAREDILNAAVPDVNSKLNDIIAQKEMINEQSEKAAGVLQEKLNKEGVKIDAMTWADLSDEQAEAVRMVNDYAKLLNRNVAFADITDTNGDIIDGVYMDGQTVINPKAKLGALSTMVHEFTHGSESSSFYGDLSELTKEYYGENLDKAVNKIKNSYATTIKLTEEGAMKELTAITTQQLLGNQDYVDRLVRYNSSLAYKLYEEIRHMNENTGNIAEAIEQNFMRAFAEQKIQSAEEADNIRKISKTAIDENGNLKAFEQQLSEYEKSDYDRRNRLIVSKNTKNLYWAEVSDRILKFRKKRLITYLN